MKLFKGQEKLKSKTHKSLLHPHPTYPSPVQACLKLRFHPSTLPNRVSHFNSVHKRRKRRTHKHLHIKVPKFRTQQTFSNKVEWPTHHLQDGCPPVLSVFRETNMSCRRTINGISRNMILIVSQRQKSTSRITLTPVQGCILSMRMWFAGCFLPPW